MADKRLPLHTSLQSSNDLLEGYIPCSSGDSIAESFLCITFLIFLIVALCFMCAKPPEDYFIKRALIYLILALFTRVMMRKPFDTM